MSKQLETVTIFRSWVEIAESLKSDAERGKLYHALCRYSLDGTTPELDGVLSSFFTIMRPSLDKSNKRKIAQEKSRQIRLQNSSQNGSQSKNENSLQINSQSEEKIQSQNGSQNGHSRARKTVTVTETGKKREPKGSPKETAVSFAEQIPTELQTDAFRKKWLEWEQFRRKKRKPISEFSAPAQLKMLSKFLPETAIEIIDFSIANDYQGLFPPKRRPAAGRIIGKDYSGV